MFQKGKELNVSSIKWDTMQPVDKCGRAVDSDCDTCPRYISKGEEPSAEPWASHAVCIKEKKIYVPICKQMLVCTPNISRKVHKLPLGKETGGPEVGVGGSLAFYCVPLIHLLIGIFTLLVNSFARILTRPFRGGSPCRQSSQVQEPASSSRARSLCLGRGQAHGPLSTRS